MTDDKITVELDQWEVEHLITRVEMEPAVETEAEVRRGHVCFSGPFQTPLGDKLRAALSTHQGRDDGSRP